jgi:hypothetical protein
MRNLIDMLKNNMETATLSIRAPVGEPGGGLFSRMFEKQMKKGSGNGASLINLMFSFLDPDFVRSLNPGTSVKYQGSHDLVSDYEAQWACFKACVHWCRKGLSPITVLLYTVLERCNMWFAKAPGWSG